MDRPNQSSKETTIEGVHIKGTALVQVDLPEGDMAALLLEHEKMKVEALREKYEKCLETMEKGHREEVERLQNTITALTNKIKNLEEEITNLKADNRTVKADNTAMQAEITNLKADNRVLKADSTAMQAEITNLKADNRVLKADNSAMKEELKDLTSKEKEREALLNGYDLARMYVYYYVMPHVCRSLKTWNEVTEMVAKLNADLQDNIITKKDYDTALKNIIPTKADIALSLPSIVVLGQERNSVAHDDIRSATNQHNFLSKFSTITWPESEKLAPYKDMVAKMLSELKTTDATNSLKRMN